MIMMIKILLETVHGVHAILHTTNLRVDMSSSYCMSESQSVTSKGGGWRDRE